MGDAALGVNSLWLRVVSVSCVRADQACHGGLCAVLSTRDVASEHTQRADISADRPDSLCAAEFISACSLEGCPDFQMSQNPRQIDKILQFCTDSISYGGWGWEGSYFQRKHGCLVTPLGMASVWKAASGAGKVNPCEMPAKSDFNLKRGKVIKGKERSL